jgi:hypothetical protein
VRQLRGTEEAAEEQLAFSLLHSPRLPAAASQTTAGSYRAAMEFPTLQSLVAAASSQSPSPLDNSGASHPPAMPFASMGALASTSATPYGTGGTGGASAGGGGATTDGAGNGGKKGAGGKRKSSVGAAGSAEDGEREGTKTKKACYPCSISSFPLPVFVLISVSNDSLTFSLSPLNSKRSLEHATSAGERRFGRLCPSLRTAFFERTAVSVEFVLTQPFRFTGATRSLTASRCSVRIATSTSWTAPGSVLFSRFSHSSFPLLRFPSLLLLDISSSTCLLHSPPPISFFRPLPFPQLTSFLSSSSPSPKLVSKSKGTRKKPTRPPPPLQPPP